MAIEFWTPEESRIFHNVEDALISAKEWIFSTDDFLSVTLENGDDLCINRNWRGAIAIVHKFTGVPGNYDASIAPTLSGRKVRFKLDETNWSPVDSNIIINKRKLRAVITEFIKNGKLSDEVYWIKETPTA